MLIIYTGSGKGKTTASFGMALRASGYGKNVLILQFVKEESWPEGARIAIRKNLSTVEIRALGSGWIGIMGDKKPLSNHKKSAQNAVKEAIKAIKSKKYDLIILDELLGTLHGKLITKKEVRSLLNTSYAIRNSPPDLVFTGRNAPKWLVDKADLVTEMKEIKHPFQKGIQAKKGN
jgi:cob(I)alamin adenosyltransferase